MARSAVVVGAGILGATAGYFLGNPQLGFTLGAAAGSAIASFALPASGTGQKGPRLSDLKVTSSAYGAFIPRAYGTVILGGNIIWSTNLDEHRKKKGGGKGAASATGATTTYNYTDSCALGLAFGVAEDVTRIWFDGKLWFDKTGTGPVIKKSGLKFRFYPGDDTQLPDPIIVADLGEANTPAWRGLAYIVFENLDLTPFGNRIPTIKVELTFNAQAAFPYQALTIPSGAPAPASNIIGVDTARGLAYAFSTSNSYLVRFSLESMQQDRWQAGSAVNLIDGSIGQYGPAVGLDGYLYMSDGSAANTNALIKVFPDSLTEKARFGFIASLANYPDTVPGTVTQIVTVQLWDGIQIATYAIVISRFSTQGNMGIFAVGDNDRYNTAGVTLVQYRYPLPGGPASFIVGPTDIASAVALDPTAYETAMALGMGPYGDIIRIVIYPTAELINPSAYDPISNGVTIDYLSPLVLDDIAAAVGQASGYYTSYYSVGAGWFDQTDSTVICFVCLNKTSGNDVVAIKWSCAAGDTAATIVWATLTGLGAGTIPSFTTTGSRLTGNSLAVMVSNVVYQFNTASGAMTSQTWPISLSAGGYSQIYDAETDSLLAFINGHNWTRLYLNRGTGNGTTDGSIVTDLCDQVGLGAGDIDVSQLTDSVYGYVITNQSKVQDDIAPLGQAFFFDPVESDYELKFVKRGGASAVTIPQDDMMWLNGGNDKNPQFMSDTITQDVDLPLSVNVTFLNKDQQNQQGSVEYRRITAPDATMGSQNKVTAALPIVMTGTDALQIAEQALDAAWNNRHQFKHALPPKYFKYDGTDVVTFSYTDGTSMLARLTQVATGADLSLDIASSSEDSVAYTPSLTADSANYPGQSVGSTGTGKLFVLDIPLLRDQDDTGGTTYRQYLTASGYGPALNPTRIVMRSYDQGVSYDEVTRIYLDATWGACTTALPDTTHPFAWTDAYTLTVILTDPGNEALASVTEADVFAGKNVAAIIKSNGDAEIIGWTTVTHNADNTYTLSHIIRGLRGSEVFTAGHVAGDIFLLLDENEVTGITAPLADVGKSIMWKVVSAGQVAADVQGIAVTTHARDLMPYAPVNYTAAWSGGDLSLGWTRRSRLAGEWVDSVETVPLNETTERYEIDIYNGSTVVRTLTVDFGATPTASPGITYTAAQIYQDFGASPPTSSIKIAVYQISAAVGRGFGAAQTVTVSGTQVASKRYYGTSANTSLTSAQIKALSSADIVSSYNLTTTYNCTGGLYPYFCFPASFGTPSHVTVNGLPFSDFSVSVVSVDGVNYNVIRFNNLQAGSSIPTVWA